MDMLLKIQVKLSMLPQRWKNAKNRAKMMTSVFRSNFAIIGVTRNMDSLTPTNALSIKKAFRKVMLRRISFSALKVEGLLFDFNNIKNINSLPIS